MKPYLTLSLLATTVTFAGCGSGSNYPGSLREAWNASNNPLHLKAGYEVRFSSLPLAEELEHMPWSDSYWPSYKAGIADRWNDEASSDPFTYELNDLNRLRRMSSDQLAKLSPAEKYDIYMGKLDYPMVKRERRRTSATDDTWHGLCHGWAPAALNFKEPQPVTLQSRDGIEVPFGSSDVKALLTHMQQQGENFRMLGDRCDYDIRKQPEHAQDPECRDTNAGAFHVVLANFIGLNDEGFVADITRDAQVWNQPVFGYHSVVTSETSDIYPGAAPGTVRVINISTSLRYISELGAHWQAMPFTDYPQAEETQELQYKLELNAQGEVIGGEWTSEVRPDFIWTEERPVFNGYLSEALTIYERSTHD